jgi:hypothetical protein
MRAGQLLHCFQQAAVRCLLESGIHIALYQSWAQHMPFPYLRVANKTVPPQRKLDNDPGTPLIMKFSLNEIILLTQHVLVRCVNVGRHRYTRRVLRIMGKY